MSLEKGLLDMAPWFHDVNHGLVGLDIWEINSWWDYQVAYGIMKAFDICVLLFLMHFFAGIACQCEG